MMMIFSCSNDDDDPSQNPNPNNPKPNNPAGTVTITNVPSGIFWGEELTITGTGFSTVKEENVIKLTNQPIPLSCTLNYTSAAGGDIEIVSATATQLKIKVPLKVNGLGEPQCGPLKANLEVTVKDKKATIENVTFGPLPFVGGFAYHYGWFDLPKVTRIGDSVMLNGGLLATPVNGSEYWDDVRLSINGTDIPIKYRTVGMDAGWSFFLPVKDYAEINCSQEPDGWAAREMDFKFYIQGTSKSATRKLFVQYLPAQTTSCDVCPSPISKSAGGNTQWKIKGNNMYYTEVRFTPYAPCAGSSQGMAIVHEPWTDEITFAVPLSLLTVDCGYAVHLTNECISTFIGNVGATP